ncbi:hypothetical protein ABPG77_009444 [Micractinium sp. CCAP 211/92]
MEGASDQENTAPGEEHSLRKMFVQGTEQIGTHRTENLFQSLEERTLTEEEQRIIQQRVALQRRMFEEYERRERKRKVAELQEVCPDLGEEEAEKALELCDGREEDAAAQLVSDPIFRRRVKAACGVVAEQPAAALPAPAPARKEAPRREAGSSSRQPSWQAKPGPRPKLIDPKTLGGNVFVGAFRGKGFKPPPKGRQPARRARAQTASTSSDSDQEEEEEEQEGGELDPEQQQSEEEQQRQQEVTEEQEQQQQQQLPLVEGEQQQQQLPLVEGEQQQQIAEAMQQHQQKQQRLEPQEQAAQAPQSTDVPKEAGGGVLLWPTAAVEAAQAQRQRYVLVQADTLEAPTDSELRTARRQLGEPSISALPGMAEQPTPASVARSRPEEEDLAAALQRAIAVAAGAGATAAAQAEGAEQVPTEAAAEAAAGSPASGHAQQEEEEESAGRSPAARHRSGRQAAAQARRLAKRAASAELSDSKVTQEEEPSSSDEDMEEQDSSEDDDFAPAPRRRRSAAAAPPPRRARPSRAAKNAAAATLAAYAIDSGEEWDADAVAADSSDDEGGLALRHGRRRGGARGGSAPASAAKRTSPARKKQRVGQESAAAMAAVPAEMPAPAAAGSPAAPAGMQHQQQGGGSGEEGTKPPPGSERLQRSSRRSPAAAEPRARAISSTGHTCRGRVKQKSHKSADLVAAGSLRAEKGWHNAGYIFPEGFHSRTLFRSSVAIDQLCVHECYIIGKGGQFWPQPTFKVVALDRPDEPLIGKSCTGCWTGILKRINAEIEARRRAGEALPPPPKTAIAGPEYFGLNQPNIQEAVEALDPEELCAEYWAGKRQRMAAAAGLPVSAAAPRVHRAPRQPVASSRRGGGGGSTGGNKGRKRRGGSDTEDEAAAEEEDETRLVSSKWSAVTRAERYRNRLQENGEDTSALDKDNPLPLFIDPITMSAVVRPAISPYGHVAGLATWKVVLAEKQQCPFTNQPLQFEQLKLLTKTNIHLHRHKIVNGTPATLAS